MKDTDDVELLCRRSIDNDIAVNRIASQPLAPLIPGLSRAGKFRQKINSAIDSLDEAIGGSHVVNGDEEPCLPYIDTAFLGSNNSAPHESLARLPSALASFREDPSALGFDRFGVPVGDLAALDLVFSNLDLPS